LGKKRSLHHSQTNLQTTIVSRGEGDLEGNLQRAYVRGQIKILSFRDSGWGILQKKGGEMEPRVLYGFTKGLPHP